MCAKIEDYVGNFTIVTCNVYSPLKQYKNYKKRLRLAKVTVKYAILHCLIDPPCNTTEHNVIQSLPLQNVCRLNS